MMKRFLKNISIVVMVLLATANLSSQNWFYFQGTITSENGMMPLANYPVFIQTIDSIQILTFTNENGLYGDSIFANPQDFDYALIGVFDCDDEFDFEEFMPPQSINVANFSICGINQDCQSFFTYYPDSQDDKKIQFFNASVGNFTYISWDFGDGNFSNEINPTHIYNEYGDYEVSLVIEDTANGCFSNYTEIIYLGDSSACNANFDYSANPMNNNEIQFFDLSVGSIASWQWDFGDGTYSMEQNPLHEYNSNGNFTVCLYVSNFMMTCFDSICMQVELGDSVNCFADFSYALDTLNNTPNSYIFSDASSEGTNAWYWDFGDGSFSEDQNPVHVYDEGGSYQVCLFTIAGPPSGECNELVCKQISTPAYYNFGGHAFIDGFPINIDENDSLNIATASLFRRVENKWRFMDEREFWKFGYYWFVDKPVGEYLLRFDLKPQSVDYQNYAPSYYQHQTNWRYATTFVLETDNQFAVDVNFKKLTNLDAGIGSISGSLTNGITCNGDIDLSYKIVKLFLDDEYVAFSKTNISREFEFSNLPNGLYRLQAEVSGRLSTVEFVQIDDNQLLSDANVLELSCDAFVGIDEDIVRNGLRIDKIYPVPAADFINIDIISAKGQIIQIELLDALGRSFETYKMTLENDKTSIKLNVAQANEGLMLYRILSDEGLVLARGKFIHGR